MNCDLRRRPRSSFAGVGGAVGKSAKKQLSGAGGRRRGRRRGRGAGRSPVRLSSERAIGAREREGETERPDRAAREWAAAGGMWRETPRGGGEPQFERDPDGPTSTARRRRRPVSAGPPARVPSPGAVIRGSSGRRGSLTAARSRPRRSPFQLHPTPSSRLRGWRERLWRSPGARPLGLLRRADLNLDSDGKWTPSPLPADGVRSVLRAREGPPGK